MLDGNIFREAKELLDKPFSEMTEEEITTFKAAMIPINILPEFQSKPVDQGLEELANMWDGKEE